MMKSFVKKKWFLVTGALVILYLIFPLIAGMLQLGPDRRGPKFYARGHHSILYGIGYEIVLNEKPRVRYNAGDRVWYYTSNKDKRR